MLASCIYVFWNYNFWLKGPKQSDIDLFEFKKAVVLCRVREADSKGACEYLKMIDFYFKALDMDLIPLSIHTKKTLKNEILGYLLGTLHKRNAGKFTRCFGKGT